MRRWPVALAAGGLALAAAAVALALTRGSGGGQAGRGIVQVGGRASGDLLRSASTPALAIDPRDPRRILLANRIERPRFSCSVFASSDGGESWRESRFRLAPVGERCYAPSVAFARDGNAYLLLTNLKGRGNEPFGGFLYTSRDGGATWSAPRRVLPPFSFQASLVPRADGSLALAYLAGAEFSRHATFGLGPPPNPVALAVAPHGGRFGPPVRASAEPLVGGPALAAGPHGELALLYWDYEDDVFDYSSFPGRYRGLFRLVAAVSTNGGRTFARHVVEPAVVPARPFLSYLPPLPALAVDPRSGALYAAWEDGRSGSGDVLFRGSDDGGATWTAARRLFASPADERTPALTVEPGGRLVALAYRIAAQGRTDVVVRVSADGGRTFSAPAALTPTPFDARIAPTVANHADEIDLGSRLGLAAAGSRTLAAWADTRRGDASTGKTDIFVAPVPHDLPAAEPLVAAGESPAPRPALLDRRLRGGCAHGPRIDLRKSTLALVRSFVSALDRGELRRAYGYFDPRWRAGGTPVRVPHPFGRFAAAYRSVTCARIADAESYDRSEDGKWSTYRLWAAVRRRRAGTRILFGQLWTHSDTARAPWSLMAFWTRELPAR